MYLLNHTNYQATDRTGGLKQPGVNFSFLRSEKEDPVNDKAVWLSGLWLMESSK